jgi:outer membrane protein assembly factor BamB
MKRRNTIATLLALGSFLLIPCGTIAQDWPQWRGRHRDAKASGFEVPKTWPKELKKEWTVPIGNGVATPALVGDKLYVFTRQGGDEVVRCLDAGTGKEVWQDKYPAQPSEGPSQGFPGPRCSPTVAEGKMVTLGVRGTLSSFDAASGKLLWRKNDFEGSWPTFFTSSSPIVIDGLCIAQLGGKQGGGFTAKETGAVVAYDVADGSEKWRWTRDATAYASPVIMNVGGDRVLIAETDKQIVALRLADGKELWQAPFVAPQRGYNAATPIGEGQILIYTGSMRGATAVKFDKKDDGLAAHELWKNTEKSVQFNTPVLKDGLLYGLTLANELFCIDTKDGKTAWSVPLGGTPPGAGNTATRAPAQPPGAGRPPQGGPPGAGGQPPGGRGGRGGMRGGGRGGYGSIVDAGHVLVALTPSAQLVVFEPSPKEFKQVAKYKVAEGDTYAYPILSGKRIFIKDKENLTLWTVE